MSANGDEAAAEKKAAAADKAAADKAAADKAAADKAAAEAAAAEAAAADKAAADKAAAAEAESKKKTNDNDRDALIASINTMDGVKCFVKPRRLEKLIRGKPPLSIVPAEGTYQALRDATKSSGLLHVRSRTERAQDADLINKFSEKLVAAAMVAWKAAKPPGSLNLKVNGFKEPPGLKDEIKRQLKAAILKEQQKLKEDAKKHGELTAATEPVGLSPEAIEVAKDMEDVKKDMIAVEGEVKAAKSQCKKTEEKVGKKQSEVKKLEYDISEKKTELKALEKNLSENLEIVKKAEEVGRDGDIGRENEGDVELKDFKLEEAIEHIRKFTEAEKQLNAAKNSLTALEKKRAKDAKALEVAQGKLKPAEAALEAIEQQLGKDKASLDEKESKLEKLKKELTDLQSEEKLAKTPEGVQITPAKRGEQEPVIQTFTPQADLEAKVAVEKRKKEQKKNVEEQAKPDNTHTHKPKP